jgi:hypothetical protein
LKKTVHEYRREGPADQHTNSILILLEPSCHFIQSGILIRFLGSSFTTIFPSGTSDDANDSDRIAIDEFEHKVNLARNIILIFIAIFTILGNTLVLLATWRERSLHQPNKYFIACLAVADLLVGVIIVPLRVYPPNFTDERMSTHICRFLKWIDIFALTASIYSLTFISFDRYLKISKPLQYKSRMTTSKSLKIIFIIWFISIAFATYAANPRSGSTGVLVQTSFCPVHPGQHAAFYTSLATCAFFLPTAVIIVMYTLIFLAAHKRQKMLRNGELGQTSGDRNQRTVFLQDLKVIRMLLLVVGVFVFSWGPLIIYVMIFFYQHKVLSAGFLTVGYIRRRIITQLIVFTLPYFNSLCNPVIYARLDQNYREAFKRLFQQMMCRRQNSIRQPPYVIELPPLRTRHRDRASQDVAQSEVAESETGGGNRPGDIKT